MMRKTCLDRLHICKGECCKVIRIAGVKKPVRTPFVTYQIGNISDDMREYFILRNITPLQSEGTITFRVRECYTDGDGVVFVLPCKKLLPDGKCSGWYDDRPQICKDLDWDTKDSNKFYITPNCIYNDEDDGVE
jgi:hypothetical protein